MASQSSNSSHSKVFRKLRAGLMKELPDPRALLENPGFKNSFSPYERSQMLSPVHMLERVEKFIDVMELSSLEAFQSFLVVLKPLKPELATRLQTARTEMSNGSGSPPQPIKGRVLQWHLR